MNRSVDEKLLPKSKFSTQLLSIYICLIALNCYGQTNIKLRKLLYFDARYVFTIEKLTVQLQ